MSRKPLSLKKSKGVSKRAGARHKQQQKSSWQTSINSYFGGKPLPTQPTLGHFVQKMKGSDGGSPDLTLSMDKIVLNDRDKSSSPPVTSDQADASLPPPPPPPLPLPPPSTNPIIGSNSAVIKGEIATDASHRGVENESQNSDNSKPIKSENYHGHCTSESCLESEGTHCVSDTQSMRHISKIVREQSVNQPPLQDEDEKFSHLLKKGGLVEVDQSTTHQDNNDSRVAVVTPKESLLVPGQRLPLSENLIAQTSTETKQLGLNPFVKLTSRVSPHLSITATSSSSSISSSLPRESRNSGQSCSTLSSKKVAGLSLKMNRKRKFVMSPSKPSQEKPVKQATGTPSSSYSTPTSTPPLFTPSPSSQRHQLHQASSKPPPICSSSSSPSLFSPSDQDLLQQYSTKKSAPCRRLSLADLEISDGKENSANKETSKTLTNKENMEGSNSVMSTLVESHYEQQSQANSFSFSAFDQSCEPESNSHDQSCDPLSKSHDQSCDFFEQSHDSFDELMKQAPHEHFDECKNSSLADVSHDPSDDITGQSHDLMRYLVLDTEVCKIEETGKPELILRLQNKKKSCGEILVHLRDEWVHTPVLPRDTVQLNLPQLLTSSSERDSKWGSPCVINNQNGGSVIVSPDLLITPTAIATSVTCPRRAILSELFKGVSKDNITMVTGNLLHQVLQGLLVKWAESGKGSGSESRKRRSVSEEDIEEMIRRTLATPDALNHLYSLGVSDEEAHSLLSSLSPSLHDWCHKFLNSSPVPGKGDIEFKRNVCDRDGMVCVAVDEVHDIEENVWSPRLGLKGKVDATLQIKMRRGRGEECSKRVPLEIKTGKMYWKQGSLDHRAQLSLYSLMLRDRYGNDSVPGGLLYYMKAGHMQGLPAEDHDIRSLLMARNTLASHYHKMATNLKLPGMLGDSHVCKYCPYLSHCSLAHKSLEGGTEESSGLGEMFQTQLQHLSQKHFHFFQKENGLGMAEMCACTPISTSPNNHFQKFYKKPYFSSSSSSTSSTNSTTSSNSSTSSSSSSSSTSSTSSTSSSGVHPLTTNDRVVVSRQDGTCWAIAVGMVAMATNEVVELTLDKPVPPSAGMEYRLDIAPSYRHGNAGLVNLARLFSSDSERDLQLRELIVDLRPPRFHPTSPPTQNNDDVIGNHGNLNGNQRVALRKVLCSKDYCLILGRPGTGKTTTISKLVEVLVARGNSVLVTSYTHSAVDNILFKLQEVKAYLY